MTREVLSFALLILGNSSICPFQGVVSNEALWLLATTRI